MCICIAASRPWPKMLFFSHGFVNNSMGFAVIELILHSNMSTKNISKRFSTLFEGITSEKGCSTITFLRKSHFFSPSQITHVFLLFSKFHRPEFRLFCVTSGDKYVANCM